MDCKEFPMLNEDEFKRVTSENDYRSPRGDFLNASMRELVLNDEDPLEFFTRIEANMFEVMFVWNAVARWAPFNHKMALMKKLHHVAAPVIVKMFSPVFPKK